jgi:ATP-dependent protease Clp ATPase subunit
MKCSFCGKSQDQVAKLIGSRRFGGGLGRFGRKGRAYICDACVATCDSSLQRAAAIAAGTLKPAGHFRTVARLTTESKLLSDCSFCRKPQHECGGIAFSRVQEAAICRRCVEICNSILANQNPNLADGGVRATSEGVTRKSQGRARRWWQLWRRIRGNVTLPQGQGA